MREDMRKQKEAYEKLLRIIEQVDDPKGDGMTVLLGVGIKAVAKSKLPNSLSGLLLKRIKERTGASMRDLRSDLAREINELYHSENYYL